VFHSVFGNMFDQKQALDVAARVLKNGGLCIVRCESRTSVPSCTTGPVHPTVTISATTVLSSSGNNRPTLFLIHSHQIKR
jgi:ubiquinone/menaquinone biosynthesis C-methylase UbiE